MIVNKADYMEQYNIQTEIERVEELYAAYERFQYEVC